MAKHPDGQGTNQKIQTIYLLRELFPIAVQVVHQHHVGILMAMDTMTLLLVVMETKQEFLTAVLCIFSLAHLPGLV